MKSVFIVIKPAYKPAKKYEIFFLKFIVIYYISVCYNFKKTGNTTGKYNSFEMYDHPRHMEPLFPKEHKALVDRAMNIHHEAAALGSILHPVTRDKVNKLLRHINSYYSNRIEGEHTTPADIERAVKKEYSRDEKKKGLQKLNEAHIDVQALIDRWLDEEEHADVCSGSFLCRIHREFYSRVPDSFLKVYDPEADEYIDMVPGELRKREVTVGDHLAPKAEALEVFLKKFSETYDPNTIYGNKKLLAVAASHHRLAWIHPFLDGNGRVTRLFSYAYMKKARIESYGLWTISRGLARRSNEYKRLLATADSPRRGDYDGRGVLSEKGLNLFCDFFFDVAEDQIRFMAEMLELEKLRERIVGYVNLRSQGLIPGEEILRSEAKFVLPEVMMRGEVPRGEAKRITGLRERTARELTSQLEEEELLESDGHRSSFRFNIPAKVVGYYFPALYPEGTI